MNDLKQHLELDLKPAIFLHIQKTAGTTIVDLARSAYGNDGFISHGDYYNLSSFPLMGDTQFETRGMQSKFGHTPFISGHFGYDVAKPFRQDRYSFTFLRNLVERVLSFCFFCKIRDPKEFEIYARAQRLSLDEFLKLGFSDPIIRSFIWNCQVTQIARGFGSTNHSSLRDKELLKLAIRHLDEFSYIGLAKTFEEDRDVILKSLGIDPPKEKIVLNAGPDRPNFQDLPDSTKRLLLELTKLDRILYKRVWVKRNSLFKWYIRQWLRA